MKPNRIPSAAGNPAEEKEVLTLLHMAAFEDKIEVIPFLLDHGFDVNVPSTTGFTPLHSATMRNHRRAAELLL